MALTGNSVSTSTKMFKFSFSNTLFLSVLSSEVSSPFSSPSASLPFFLLFFLLFFFLTMPVSGSDTSPGRLRARKMSNVNQILLLAASPQRRAAAEIRPSMLRVVCSSEAHTFTFHHQSCQQMFAKIYSAPTRAFSFMLKVPTSALIKNLLNQSVSQ